MDFRGCLAEATPARILWPRHIVSVSKRPDGRCEYEETCEAPPNQDRSKSENVMAIFLCGHRRPEVNFSLHLEVSKWTPKLGV
jgi:hypothetical protein